MPLRIVDRLLNAAPVPRTNQVQRAIRGNPVQPSAEAGAFIEFVKLPVGAQESFLHNIFGVRFVSSHTKSQAEQGSAVPLDEHTKGVRITRTCLFHHRLIGEFHPVVG